MEVTMKCDRCRCERQLPLRYGRGCITCEHITKAITLTKKHTLKLINSPIHDHVFKIERIYGCRINMPPKLMQFMNQYDSLMIALEEITKDY